MSSYEDAALASWNMFQELCRYKDGGCSTIKDVLDRLRPEIIEAMKDGALEPTEGWWLPPPHCEECGCSECECDEPTGNNETTIKLIDTEKN